jgi:large repetitive protein
VATAVGPPPAATPPTPTFTFSPASAGVNDTIFFNGSTSTAGLGHTLASFTWAFGDGSTATGVMTSHSYGTAGTYIVQLTVVDEAGQSATSAGTSVAIGGASPSAPVANFTFSPLQPNVNDQVVFDSSSTTVASGQSIVDVAWNFGDDTPIIHGPPNSTRITAHSYPRAATFVVNLVVTDSVGRTGQKSTSVTVGTGNPTAKLTVTKAGGLVVTGDGSQSTAVGSSQIVTYRFAWGDGTFTSSAASVVNHTYLAGGTYTVTLTVTDDFVPTARTNTTTAPAVTVP